MRLSIRQSHPATIDGARADEETAQHRQDGFARALHFAQRQAIQSVSGVDRQKGRREPKPKGDRKPRELAPKIDFTGKEVLGKCPKCGGKVFETEDSYICEASQADRKPCKFKLSKRILGRDIPKEQAQKLLTTGKTDLLDSFISKRGRPFSAYLKLEDGKVGFEFPEKAAPAKESKQASVS